MTTYTFTAFSEDDILESGDNSLSAGDVFTMPTYASLHVTVEDNDAFLSGDYDRGEQGDDTSGQTATIELNGADVGNGGRIYAEQVWYVEDQYGNQYTLVEMEQAGDTDIDDFFTFYNGGPDYHGTPPADAVLTVISKENVKTNYLDYKCFDGGPKEPVVVGDKVTFQAEDLHLDGFVIQYQDNAANSHLIKVSGHEGTATVKDFAGDGQHYDIEITYVDENDGQGSIELLVDGVVVETLVLNRDNNGNGYEHVSFSTFTFYGIDVPQGADVSLRGTSDYGEFIRIDQIEFCKAEKPIELIATDDFIVVSESEGVNVSGVFEDILDAFDDDTATADILDNDTQDGQAYTGQVVTVDGVTANIGNFIDLAGGGRIKINADGTVDFDADGDFDSLNNGDTATVSVDYTISASGAATNTNLLFVIDTSGSTLGENGLAEGNFSGVGAGDQNDDDRNDTVLDAELLAVKSAVEALRQSVTDPSTVTIGLVTFDTAGAVRGTFSLDDAGLIPAIMAIQGNPNGWTNYEDGLNKAIDWFGSLPADPDAENKVVFLSDGVPRDPDGSTIQDNGDYGDEVATLQGGTINATIEAIAIGDQAELVYLDDLDSGNNALRVNDAATLTTAVADASKTAVTATGTVNILINGEDDAPTLTGLDAIDDFIIVRQDEGVNAPDVFEDILDRFDDTDAVANILVNDDQILSDGPRPDYTGSVVEVNGVTGNVGDFIDLAGGGAIKIMADGRVDFDAQGDFTGTESQVVQVNYTIADKTASTQKTNLLFVLDTSGSTLGLNGLAEGVFSGTGAGEQNGDGRVDTVLDAQILAVKTAIAALQATVKDPANVTVGLVTFDTAGAIEGTFALDDAGLIDAVMAIQGNPNGWTNYEDGLNKAIDWFGTRPTDDGAENKVVFLSDGVPRDPDGVTIQDNGDYGDEVTTLTDPAGLNAEIEAIAIGDQSVLSALTDLDSGGSPLQVSNAAPLTTAVTAASQIKEVSDEATVFIKVLGDDTPAPTIDAIDDALTVFEDEPSGDTEILDPQSANISTILNNDVANGSPYQGEVLAVNGATASVNQWVELEKGRVKINSDGTVDFDAENDFLSLNNGETDQVSVTYTIGLGGGTGTQVEESFDGFSNGQIITGGEGFSVRAVRAADGTNGTNQAMIFDTNLSPTADPDLEVSVGPILIISEDGNPIAPDDNAGGGTFFFEFDQVSDVDSLQFVDLEGTESGVIRLFDDAGTLITTINANPTGNAMVLSQDINVSGVKKMEVELSGSGGIDFVRFTPTVQPVVADTATVTINVLGISDADPTFSLSGTVVTDLKQTVTFIIDHSDATMDNFASPSSILTDFNGDNSIARIDLFLAQIVEAAKNLEADREVTVLLMGDSVRTDLTLGDVAIDPLVSSVTTTAGVLATTSSTDLGNGIFAGFSTSTGTRTELNVGLALEEAKLRITESGSNLDGNATDDIVILTSTNGQGTELNSNGEVVNIIRLANEDRNSDGIDDLFLSPTLSVFDPNDPSAVTVPVFVSGIVEDTVVGTEPAVEETAELAALNAAGADVEVVLIDPLGDNSQQALERGVLEGVDANDVIVSTTDVLPFGLESLVSAELAAATVIGVSAGGAAPDGTFEALTGTDTPDGFVFNIDDLPFDPSVSVFVEIDRDGNTLTSEQSIDVTSLLDTNSSFVLDLNDQLDLVFV
ncbi:MAG: vWA domain-containing protein [Pseudomonadota bacterium]